MMRFFKRTGQRLAALGLLGLVFLVAWTELVSPVWEHYTHTRMEIEEGRLLLARYQRIAVNEDRIAELVRQSVIEPDLEEFLTGSSEAVSVADLQVKLREIVRESGAKLRSANPLRTKAEGGLRVAGLRLELTGSPKSVRRAIYAMESSKPLLFIPRANIRRIPGTARKKDPGPTKLETRLDVIGVLWEGEG